MIYVFMVELTNGEQHWIDDLDEIKAMFGSEVKEVTRWTIEDPTDFTKEALNA